MKHDTRHQDAHRRVVVSSNVEALETSVDVLIIGGGAAGLAAALLLGRALRSVVLVDGGNPRNAPAAHMHGYLGHEGIPPRDFLAIGRDEVGRYGVEIVDGDVTDIVRDGDHFRAAIGRHRTVSARRVLLATGLEDVLPDIPGLAAQWGTGVIHCPYCHGWEVRDRPLVVVGTGPASEHLAALFRQWSDDVTFVVHEGAGPDATVRAQFAARGITVVDEPVADVVSDGDHLTGIRLQDGAVVRADAIVIAPRFTARAQAVAALGLDATPDPTGMGMVIETDQSGATAVPGVFAAGNAADARGQVLQAAAAGGMAGIAINADLVAEETDACLSGSVRQVRASTDAEVPS